MEGKASSYRRVYFIYTNPEILFSGPEFARWMASKKNAQSAKNDENSHKLQVERNWVVLLIELGFNVRYTIFGEHQEKKTR